MKHFIDFHSHPTLKPFGRSFQLKNTQGRNSPNRNRRHSIYHRQGLTPLRKKVNNFLTLTKFTQADFSTVHDGKTRILVVSLYPLEKPMILDANGVKFTGRLLRNLATGIGMKRIRHLQKMPDYFQDLLAEYQYYLELDGIKVTKKKEKVRYKLVKNYSEITDFQPDGIPTVFVILSFEGCHVFNTGLQLAGRPKAKPSEVLANIKSVKNWEFPPFFIGLAHHFANEICGHEKSIGGLVDLVIKQKVNANQGITALGKKVIAALLSKTNGKRIPIDLKHMNVKSRYEYYQILKEEYNNKVPLIVSHGAVNGMNNPIDKNRIDAHFNADTINFYDDEVLRIARSKGIFGVQLDERRICDTRLPPLAGRNKSAKLIWLQIEHMAKYLDTLNLPAWNIQCIGSDFDGIIDPLPGFWTVKDLDHLPKFLTKHAEAFLKSTRGKKLKVKNKLSAEKIVQKFMFENAEQFLKTNFK